MDFGSIYHFLFETYAGIGCLVGAGLVISVILCVILENRTRKTYKDRGPKQEGEDEWSLFNDDGETTDDEPAKKAAAKKAPKPEEKKPEIKKVTVRRRVDNGDDASKE